MRYHYQTASVCAKAIDFDLNGNIVTNIQFTSGCPGNLAAISKLVDGWTIEQISEKLAGNTCKAAKGPTSCTDQLVQALQAAAVEEARHNQLAQAS